MDSVWEAVQGLDARGREEALDLVMAFEDLRQAAPLATEVFWHAAGVDEDGRARTSQLVAARQLGAVFTLWLGGNRTGKTVVLLRWMVAMALGRDHPGVVVWCLVNGIDPLLIPVGPGRVWVVALTSGDSVRYHRKPVRKLLPPSAQRWWNYGSKGEARCEVSVPGYAEPAEIYFRSCDQGEDAMQGDSCRAIGFDEEPTSEALVEEAEVRLWDQRGRMFFSMTPLKGFTWIIRRFVQTPDVDVKVHELHTIDNPYVPRERLDRLRKHGHAALADARLFGRPVALKGRIYSIFERRTHVVPPFEVPPFWPRHRGIDFGTRNPFCCLWMAVAPSGQRVVYREHYQAEQTSRWHVKQILLAEGWRERTDAEMGELAEQLAGRKARIEDLPMSRLLMREASAERIEESWADPEDAQALLSIQEEGLACMPADKSVQVGIDDVYESLKLGPDGAPGLVVFDTCLQTISEFETYMWAPEVGGVAKERPLKRRDHAMDTLRYLSRGLAMSGGW